MKQKHKWNRQKMIYAILSLLCFLLVFCVTYNMQGQQPKQQQYSIVVLGDSIMGQYRDDTSVSSQLGSLLGQEVFNGALGGTSLSRIEKERRIGYTKDSLSVTALAEAIAANDFGVQQTVRIRESATEYFADTIDELQTIDFEKVETILVCAGVNDYHAGVEIYPEEDDYDAYTFVGALRRIIRDIRNAYPHIQIVLVTPTYTWYKEVNLTCEEYDLGGGILEQYVDAQREVAQEMDVEIIDLYHDVYPQETFADWQLYTSDGVHPNDLGRKMIAEIIAQYLKD